MSHRPKISLALADDHALFRLGVVSILKDYEELEILFDAQNGKELLEKLAAHPEKPKVCIVDINMPVMNGYDTVKQIRRQYKDIRVLALSMYHDEINIIQMLRSGAHGYVLKDSEPKVLFEAIKAVYETGFYSSELITPGILHTVKFADNNAISFTQKELDFIRLCCTEKTYKEMAPELDLSERTIDGYRDRLFERLHVRSRVGIVTYALRHGLVALY